MKSKKLKRKAFYKGSAERCCKSIQSLIDSVSNYLSSIDIFIRTETKDGEFSSYLAVDNDTGEIIEDGNIEEGYWIIGNIDIRPCQEMGAKIATDFQIEFLMT